MSAVYCAHGAVQPYGAGGFLVCGLCGKDWYASDPAPLVIIGFTAASEVSRYPFLEWLRERRDKLNG